MERLSDVWAALAAWFVAGPARAYEVRRPRWRIGGRRGCIVYGVTLTDEGGTRVDTASPDLEKAILYALLQWEMVERLES